MAKTCTQNGIYDSLKWCPGQQVLPGIRRVLYIPKAYIAKWPTLPALTASPEVTMDKLATYTGDFTLLSDKKWMDIGLLTAKSNLTSESQGEVPSTTFLNKASVLYPGTDADATGFARQANIDQIVYLVQQRDGQFRVLGSEAFDVFTKVSQASGEGVTGQGGTTLSVEATDICPAPFYGGKIETAEGDISGKDGTPVLPA